MYLGVLFCFLLLLKHLSGIHMCVLNHFCNPMACSLPGSSVHGILQARILEWVAMPSSWGSSSPKDQTHSLVSPALAGRFFSTSATWEAPTGRDKRKYHFWRPMICFRSIIWSSASMNYLNHSSLKVSFKSPFKEGVILQKCRPRLTYYQGHTA